MSKHSEYLYTQKCQALGQSCQLADCNTSAVKSRNIKGNPRISNLFKALQCSSVVLGHQFAKINSMFAKNFLQRLWRTGEQFLPTNPSHHSRFRLRLDLLVQYIFAQQYHCLQEIQSCKAHYLLKYNLEKQYFSYFFRFQPNLVIDFNFILTFINNT